MSHGAFDHTGVVLQRQAVDDGVRVATHAAGLVRLDLIDRDGLEVRKERTKTL